MKIKNMTKEELELLSLCDITALILNENKKSMNTAIVFKKICELLEYSDDEFNNKIGEFYTSLTTDKRFIMLENAEWDLRDNHSVKFNLEEDETEEITEEEPEEVIEDEIDDNIDDDSLNLDDDDNEIDNLSIIIENEEEME